MTDEYVDKDYLVDYQKFYSRSFDEETRFTKRIHFFVEEFSKTRFEESLENNDIVFDGTSIYPKPLTSVEFKA